MRQTRQAQAVSARDRRWPVAEAAVRARAALRRRPASIDVLTEAGAIGCCNGRGEPIRRAPG